MIRAEAISLPSIFALFMFSFVLKQDNKEQVVVLDTWVIQVWGPLVFVWLFFFFCFNANSSGIETITWGLKTFLISISSIRLCNTLMIPLISSKFSIVPPLSYHVGYDQPPPLLSLLTPCHTPPSKVLLVSFHYKVKTPRKWIKILSISVPIYVGFISCRVGEMNS